MSHEKLYGQIFDHRPPHRPWSLAEAGTSRFFAELKQWAEWLEVHTFDALAHQQPCRVGALLLCIHAEVIRRFGHEGQLWAVLSNRDIVRWQPQTWGRLYNQSGNLQISHGQLLEKAARWLELRHAFDVEDAHKWYRLIHLQFGFTHEDAKSRLKDWLSGQVPPVAVQTLFEDRDPGAMEFQRTWHRLRQYRLGNVSKAGMKEHLKSCCWVLPEWTEDLLKAALAANVSPLADDEEQTASQFHTSPSLRWDGSGLPSFHVELCHLNEIETTGDLMVRAQGNVLARLIKQDAGGFASDTQGALSLGEGAELRSRVDLRLIAADESLVRQSTLSLWDADAEVSLFRPSDGLMVAESQLRTGQAFDIIAAGDLELIPAPSLVTTVGVGYRLHRYERGWAGLIEARMDDVVLWTSAGLGKQAELLPSGVVRADWTQILNFESAANHVWPWKVPLRIQILDPAWRFSGMRWTRADGKLMIFKNIPSELTLVEGDIAHSLVLRVSLRHDTGRVATIPVRLPPPMKGCVRWSEDGKPVIHAGDKTLLIGHANRAMWSFFLPVRRDDLGNTVPLEQRRCSFMEGDVVRGDVKTRAMILPRLGGYGAPAWISEDPYIGTQHTMEVAPRVIDGGVIGNVRVNGELDQVTVQRMGSFDLTEKHDMFVWITFAEKPGGVVKVNRDLLRSIESGWEFPFPTGGSLLAVALFYEGHRLGSWFSSSRWSQALLYLPCSEAEPIAGLLRVWRAPLLVCGGGEDHRSQVVSWLREHWMTVLPIWLLKKGLLRASGMEQTPVPVLDDEWKRAVHALLNDLQPSISPEQVQGLVAAVSSGCSSPNAVDRLGYCLLELAEMSPLLAARTLSAALKAPFVNDLPASGRHLVSQMRACFPCRDETADEIALRHGNRDGHWLRTTIPSLQSLERPNQPLPRAYLRLSGSEEFRKFAFGVWLEEIRQRFHL